MDLSTVTIHEVLIMIWIRQIKSLRLEMFDTYCVKNFQKGCKQNATCFDSIFELELCALINVKGKNEMNILQHAVVVRGLGCSFNEETTAVYLHLLPHPTTSDIKLGLSYLMQTIFRSFGTAVFCSRHLD